MLFLKDLREFDVDLACCFTLIHREWSVMVELDAGLQTVPVVEFNKCNALALAGLLALDQAHR